MNIWAYVLFALQFMQLGILMAKWGQEDSNRYGWAHMVGVIATLVLLWLALR